MGTGIFVRLVFILNKILAAFNMKFIPPWRRGLFIEIGLDEDINIKEKLAKLVECNLTNDFFFLQIGANDGVSFDPIHQLVTRYKLKGICIILHTRTLAKLRAYPIHSKRKSHFL